MNQQLIFQLIFLVRKKDHKPQMKSALLSITNTSGNSVCTDGKTAVLSDLKSTSCDALTHQLLVKPSHYLNPL